LSIPTLLSDGDFYKWQTVSVTAQLRLKDQSDESFTTTAD